MTCMENIKNQIKNTYIYQHKKCVDQRYRVLMLEGEKSAKQCMIEAIARTKPVYLKKGISNYKSQQYKKLFKTVQINFVKSKYFIYCLDENVIMFHRHKVIDNMPVDYQYVLDNPLSKIRENSQAIEGKIGIQNVEFLNGIDSYLDSVVRCLKQADFSECDKAFYIDCLLHIKNKPAQTLREALQRILFWNQCLWQTGHTLNGFGRLDKILEGYEADDNSLELIKDFLITAHSHYELKSSAMVGDTGQIIILGGVCEDGSYFSNYYTELFLRAITELVLPDPKLLLRVSESMPEHILLMVLECLKSGNGSPLLSNDDVILPALEQFGYTHSDASNYGVSACWEPLIIGKSLEQNNLANVEFAVPLLEMIYNDSFLKCNKYDDVVDLYCKYLRLHVKEIVKFIDQIEWERDPIMTLFTDSCLINNKDISEGGADYNNYGVLSVGLETTVNSLLNIKEYIYDKQIISPSTLQIILMGNYKEKRYKDMLSCGSDFFGTDNKIVIELTNLITGTVAEEFGNYRNRFGGKVKFGLSSPGYINKGKNVGATADGRCMGEPFSTHISSKNRCTPTEVISFGSMLNYNGLRSNGNVVDLLLQPSFVYDKEGLFHAFIKGCLKKGFFQMQFNIVSYQQLMDAKEHPEKYPYLIVRVWGFSAYFKDVPEEYQDVLIRRAKECEGIA